MDTCPGFDLPQGSGEAIIFLALHGYLGQLGYHTSGGVSGIRFWAR